MTEGPSMRRSVSLLLLLSLSLNGCAQWVATTVPPHVALPPADPQHVRVLMRDSSLVELRFAVADSAEITGRRDWPTQAWVAVPRDSVVSLAVRRGNGAGTAVALVAGIGILLFLADRGVNSLGQDIVGAFGGRQR